MFCPVRFCGLFAILFRLSNTDSIFVKFLLLCERGKNILNLLQITYSFHCRLTISFNFVVDQLHDLIQFELYFYQIRFLLKPFSWLFRFVASVSAPLSRSMFIERQRWIDLLCFIAIDHFDKSLQCIMIYRYLVLKTMLSSLLLIVACNGMDGASCIVFIVLTHEKWF